MAIYITNIICFKLKIILTRDTAILPNMSDTDIKRSPMEEKTTAKDI